MLFAGLWDVKVVKGTVSWCGNQNKPVKGKQMFVDSYREGSSRDRKGRKKAKFGRSDGITRNRGEVWAFGAKRGNMKKGKPSE